MVLTRSDEKKRRMRDVHGREQNFCSMYSAAAEHKKVEKREKKHSKGRETRLRRRHDHRVTLRFRRFSCSAVRIQAGLSRSGRGFEAMVRGKGDGKGKGRGAKKLRFSRMGWDRAFLFFVFVWRCLEFERGLCYEWTRALNAY